jgi:hypothetical protein
MKLRVYYDGNPANTQVIDKDTNEIVDGVVSVHIDISAFDTYVTLVLADAEVDIDNLEVNDAITEGVLRERCAANNQQDIAESGP